MLNTQHRFSNATKNEVEEEEDEQNEKKEEEKVMKMRRTSWYSRQYILSFSLTQNKETEIGKPHHTLIQKSKEHSQIGRIRGKSDDPPSPLKESCRFVTG